MLTRIVGSMFKKSVNFPLKNCYGKVSRIKLIFEMVGRYKNLWDTGTTNKHTKQVYSHILII